jgi:Uncharacterized protein, possibly involved in aromatic compounds catabolism
VTPPDRETTTDPVIEPRPAPITGSYPPERHVLRDLRLESESSPGLGARGWITFDEHLRGRSGLPHPGALATLVDAVGGGLAATAARPDWIATADLTLHVMPRAEVQRAEAIGRVVRKGRTTVVIEVQLATETGEELGLATMTFAVLPRREGNPVIDQAEGVTRTTMALDHSGFTQSLEVATGLTTIDASAGAVELPLTDYVRNSLGSVQGGMMAMTGAAAAERALTHAAGTRLDIVDLQVTYLTLAKVGPVVSTTTVLALQPTFGTAHVELSDTGADNRVTTIVRARGVRIA